MDGSYKDVSVGTSPKKELMPIGSEKVNGGGSPSSGRSSPDANCPICLGKLENKSFTDSCLHQFCFTCILQWSKVKPECPLCKQCFKSIIHTVRSIEDYEQYYLSTAPAEGGRLLELYARYEPSQQVPFRYRTTVSSYLDYFVRLEEAINNHHLPPEPLRRRRINGTSEFRRNIYQQGLWVQRTEIITGRTRESSPNFYRSNPAQVHRLVPWLNRELNVLCNGNENLAQLALGRILTFVLEFNIHSPQFTEAVTPFVGRHTEHFVHEFHSFATSPFDLVGYDRHTHYFGRSAFSHLNLSEPNDNGNDSDVQIVGPFPATSPLHSIQLDSENTSDSDECVVVESVPARHHSPEVITLDSDDDDVVQVNINIDQPGPSTSSSSCRLPLKRRWLSGYTKSHDVNVSINIAHTSSRSPDDTSSVSSWSPRRKKSSKVKTKRKKLKGKKRSKGKSARKSSTECDSSSSDDRSKSVSPVLKTRKRKQSVALKMSSDEEESDVLHIVTNEEFSTSSSSESDYKPRLRSVVIKSDIKQEPLDLSQHNRCISNSDMPQCSNSSWSDGHRSRSSHQMRSYSPTSSNRTTHKSHKHSKKKSRSN